MMLKKYLLAIAAAWISGNVALASDDVDSIACAKINNVYATLTDEPLKGKIDSIFAKYKLGEFNNATDLRKAYEKAFEESATANTDMTGFIQNPNFDDGDAGWTHELNGPGDHTFQNSSSYESMRGFMEFYCGRWSEGSSKPYVLPDGKISQTIAHLPKGIYKLTADVISTQLNAGDDGYVSSHDEETGVYFFAKGTLLTKSDPLRKVSDEDHSESFTFCCYGEDIEIGILIENTNCNWVGLDNVELTYLEAFIDPLQAYKDTVVAAREKAETILHLSVLPAMSKDAASALSQKYDSTANYASCTSQEILETMASELNAAYENAVASALYYNTLYSNYSTRLSTLDASGQAYLAKDADCIELLSQYQKGTLDETEAGKSATDELINKKIVEGIKHQGPGADMTGAIVLPTCLVTGESASEWTMEMPYGGDGPLNADYAMFEYNAKTAEPRSDAQFDFYQTITGLPNGTYTVSVDVHNSLDGETDAQFKPTVAVYGNDSTTLVDVEGEDFNTYSTTAIVADGTLRIGIKTVEPIAARWVEWKNFTLIYESIEYIIPTAMADSLLKSVPTGKMSSNASGTLSDAKEAFEADKTSPFEYYYLKSAIDAANESAAYYAVITPYVNIYKGLDDAGKSKVGWPASAIIGSDYEYGLIDEVAFPDPQAMINNYVLPDLIKGVKAQTKENADMTFAIKNASFENGDTSGWTIKDVTDATEVKLTTDSNYQMSNADGDYLCYVESNAISQTINGLQNGTYTVTAVMASETDKTLQLTVNGTTVEETATGKEEGIVLSCTAYVTNGTLTISANEASAAWFTVDNFTLTRNNSINATATLVITSKYNTFVAPFDVKLPEGVTAYTVSETTVAKGIHYVTLTEVEDTLKAHTPVIVMSENEITQNYEGTTVKGDPKVGYLVGVYAPTTVEKGDFTLQTNDNVSAFYVVNEEEVVVSENRAYMVVPSDVTTNTIYIEEVQTTSIDLLDVLNTGDFEIYNISGIRINAFQKGVNILLFSNGKIEKVLVK